MVIVFGGCAAADNGPAKAEYVAEADRICAASIRAVRPLAQRIQRAQRGADPDQVFGEVADLTRRSAVTAAAGLQRLDALRTPAADRDALKGWIADQRRRQSLLTDLGDAFAQRRETTISTLSQRIDALTTKNRAFAAAYGLKTCARA